MESREKFIEKINKAFAECDTTFIANNVTEDIQWKIVGEKTISGREAFKESLERMKLGGPMEISLVDIISQDNKTAVEGIVKFKTVPGKKKIYAFCDIYVFRDSNTNKFKELRTYVSQIKNKI